MNNIKRSHMQMLSEYKDTLCKKPQLKYLFFELTVKCNEHCLHCGSSCGDVVVQNELTTEEYFRILDQVKADFGTKGYMLCITGGEPLLRKDFFEIMSYACELGFSWGMTSNATLITPEVAHKLRLAGMKTISVSIDGLREEHDFFRQSPGGYDRAINGIQNLIAEGGFKHIQVTTVATHRNIGQLNELADIMENMDIDSWRVINLEPIGRANLHPELLLNDEDYRYLFDFIVNKRESGWPVSYGCSHYLGEELERETRDWYFQCNAGIYVASIMSNGDIVACLDIERRPELVQGNIRTDRFKDVWENGFGIFRNRDYRKCANCENCPDWNFCGGDSFHTWNFDDNKPNLCLKEILEK